MGAAKLTGYPPGILEASPHVAPPSKPAFQPENPWSPMAALQEEAWLLVFSWVLFCRLLPDLLSPASASNGLSCASDLVSSWEASHARSVLCSSCRRQTPILCFGPRGHGLNTTKIFLSFMNVRSGGLASPSQDGRGTRQRRKQLLVPHLLPGGCLGPWPSLGGRRAGQQVNGWRMKSGPSPR